MEFSEKNKTEFIEKFIENVKNLNVILDSSTNDELNEKLSQQSSDDAGRAFIEELCEGIDLYHAKKNELRRAKVENPKLKIDEWLEEELVNSLKNINIEGVPTDDDTALRAKIRDVLDEQIVVMSSKL